MEYTKLTRKERKQARHNNPTYVNFKSKPERELTEDQKARIELSELENKCLQAIKSNQDYDSVASLINQTNSKLRQYQGIIKEFHAERLADTLICFLGRNSKRDENGDIISLDIITQKLDHKFYECYDAFEKTLKEESVDIMEDFREKFSILRDYLSENSNVLTPNQKDRYNHRVEDFYNWFLGFSTQSIKDSKERDFFDLYHNN